MLKPGFLDQVQKQADYLRTGLEALAQTKRTVLKVRGKGLLQGLVLAEGEAPKVMEAMREHKVLVLLAGPQVLRILPPLTSTEEEVDQFLAALERCLT